MPRAKPKPVAPAFDIPDDLLDAALGIDPATPAQLETERASAAVFDEREGVDPPAQDEDEADPTTLEEVVTALVPLGDQLRATVAEIRLIPIARATPAQRSRLADLRQQLDGVRRDLSTWVDAIDIGFRRAAEQTGSDEIILEDGIVKVEAPRGEWVVSIASLRDDLKRYVASGAISQAEYDEVFKTVVTEKVDNAKLNYIERHRGEELKTVIAQHRVWKPGDPGGAKVKFQRRADA